MQHALYAVLLHDCICSAQRGACHRMYTDLVAVVSCMDSQASCRVVLPLHGTVSLDTN